MAFVGCVGVCENSKFKNSKFNSKSYSKFGLVTAKYAIM